MYDLPLYEQNPVSHDPENGLPIPRWLDPSLEEENTKTRELGELLEFYMKPGLMDPIRFIQDEIRRMIETSSASPATKARIYSGITIRVAFNEPSPFGGGLLGTATPPSRATQEFDLQDIVLGQHFVALKQKVMVKVIWPRDFPGDLINALESANLQDAYKNQVIEHFTHPDGEYIYKLLAEEGLLSRLEHHAGLSTTTDSYRNLIKAYQQKKVRAKRVYFRDSYLVTQAACIEAPDNLSGVEPRAALLVFLGAPLGDAVVELPGDKVKRKDAIETSKTLEKLVFKRLSIYDRLKAGEFDLQYTGIQKRTNEYLRDASLTFYNSDDIVSHLYVTNLERLVSDIDTLVSTYDERLSDNALELLGAVLTVAAMGVFAPTIGAGLAARTFMGFVFGTSTLGIEVARGMMADHPEDAYEHYKAAVIGGMLEVATLMLSKMAKTLLTAASKKAMTGNVLKRMRFDGVTPPLYHDIPKLNRSIVPSEMGVMHIKRRLFERLRKGPTAAQDMVYEYARCMRKTVENHDVVIYRGQVFRGDMRPPHVIFEEGFQLRTPVDEIRKDIHQITGVRGGFGGGRNALDPDGKGISTSVFYYKEHTGAFVYGGNRGGFTYIIDTIDMDGYHLYANHHINKYPHSRPINLRPTEINYGDHIPGNRVLGAYNKAGRFIPNNEGMELFARRHASDIEMQLAEAATMATGKTGGHAAILKASKPAGAPD